MNKNAAAGNSSAEDPARIPEKSRGLSRKFGWVIALCLFIGLLFVLMPVINHYAYKSARKNAALRAISMNNLRGIGLALHNYNAVWETFPPAYTVDDEGRPLHSWRVLILPMLDQQALYDKIDLTKPWDDPVNAEFRQQAPEIFRSPVDTSPAHHTSYIAVVGEEFVFSGEQPHNMEEITDGVKYTLLVVEASGAESFEWMAPHDSNEELFLSEAATSSTFFPQGRQVVFCDGHASTLKVTSPDQLRALLTIAAEDDPGEF